MKLKWYTPQGLLLGSERIVHYHQWGDVLSKARIKSRFGFASLLHEKCRFIWFKNGIAVRPRGK